jgi:hypothetical protein
MKEPSEVKQPFRIYDDFDGRFMKIEEMRDHIPQFKAFYYEKKIENPKTGAIAIINEFNKIIAPDKFFPYSQQYRRWRKHWDLEIISKISGVEQSMVVAEQKVIKTRDENNALLAPSHEELEQGAKSLAGELMNDAMTMLKSDQQNEDLYEDEVIIKRRNYALNVFNYVMRAVTAKEALAIKRQAEKRETAGFLMDLVRASTAGKITEDDLNLLKNSIPHNEQPMAVHN